MRFLCVNTELGPLLVVDCGLVLTEAAPPDCSLRISEPALLKSRSKCFMVIPPISSGCSGQLIPDTTLSFSSARAGANPSLN